MATGPIPHTPHRPGHRIEDFSPSALRAYLDCPERFYRTYISNERVGATFNRAIIRGSAVHKVLARIFNARKDGELLEMSIELLAEQMLPRWRYERAAAGSDWETDVKFVIPVVEAGLRRIPEHARIVTVETSVSHIRSTNSPVAGARLVGKVDLIIRHPEGMFEHFEFKTGGARRNELQDVICRIGVCEKHGIGDRPVLATVCQLATGEEWTLDGDKSVLRRVLSEIETAILEIWNATTWPARMNDRCGLCDYRTNLCSLQGDWSKPNRITAW